MVNSYARRDMVLQRCDDAEIYLDVAWAKQ